MNGLFEGTRQIVASEVMRLRSLGRRRRDAALKTWLAHQPSRKPAEQDNSAPDNAAGADGAHAASE
jgi:hypothetical protein